MKIVNYLVVAILATGVLVSRKKEDEASEEDKAKAEQFKAFIQSKQFQIREYYSDKVIDYVEDDDTVKQETNLWPYVSPWIKDDFNVIDIPNGKVTVTQNASKVPGNSAEVFIKDVSVGADKDGPYFNFLNYLYEPLKYRIVEFTDSSFLIYVDWHSGAKVFTRFEIIQ